MSDDNNNNNSNNNKIPPDPRYIEWEKRSRQELKERLYEAVDKRRETTEELIPKVISEELNTYRINNICTIPIIYRISHNNIIIVTKKLIDKQIDEWKGLRWWRFDDKNRCDTWSKWFKKAKCWQDQNQHKPLGIFWCLVLDSLRKYINNISYNIYSTEINKQNKLSDCLFSKCLLSILKGAVRFERTRETPLLPVRVLTQSKELQDKLYKINNGFTLNLWKQQTQQLHKKQKQLSQKRSNIATLLNDKCLKQTTFMYQNTIKSLKQIIPNLNIPLNNNYGPSRGKSNNILSVQTQRYSPILSSDNDSISSSSNNNNNELNRLNIENQQLKLQVQQMKSKLENKQSFNIPSPMTISQHSIHLNDGKGGHSIYQPKHGTMFFFPKHSSSIINNNNNNMNNTIDFDNIINNTPVTPGIHSQIFPYPFPFDDDGINDYYSPYKYSSSSVYPNYSYPKQRDSFDTNTCFDECHPTQFHYF